MRSTMELWFADTGWTVLTAADGQQAVEKLSEDVDVLVCDRQMPKLTASKVLDYVEEQGLDPAVVILSAYEPDEEMGEDEVDAYLNKPIRKNVLTTVISRVA